MIDYGNFSKALKNLELQHNNYKNLDDELAELMKVEEIKTRRDEADSLVKGMNAEVVGDDPDKASEVVENVQQNPDSSPIDRAVAAALSLQRQNRS